MLNNQLSYNREFYTVTIITGLICAFAAIHAAVDDFVSDAHGRVCEYVLDIRAAAC